MPITFQGLHERGRNWHGHSENALKEAGLNPEEVSFVSAHGTATLYNDEMESKALGIAGLQHVPVNSFKGYWGHTLGAAGVIESIATYPFNGKQPVVPFGRI